MGRWGGGLGLGGEEELSVVSVLKCMGLNSIVLYVP